MKVTKQMVEEFKTLNAKVRANKATSEEFKRAKELASIIKGKSNRHERRATSVSNDINWYNKYPDLLKDVANVIFNEIAGTKFPIAVKQTLNNLQYPVVGAAFEIVPTIGRCFEPNHPFNYQMRDLWLQLHRAYRGVGTYEYADLGIAMYAIMMVFADIARAERIYAMASKFVARNRSFPSVILSAMGFDPATMSAEKLADFRYQLNRCIAKAGILCLPKGFSAFELYIRLFGNIFKDSDNIRAQWYFYDSRFRLDYDPTFATGGSIVYSDRTATGTGGVQTLDDVILDINTQLDNLLSDTDIARICSDVLKAFGDNGVQTLLPVPEDFSLDIVKDDVRLEQLHNTVLCGNIAGGGFSSTIFTALGTISGYGDSLRIYQEGGVVKQHLYAHSTGVTPGAFGTSNYKTYNAESVPTITAAMLGQYSADDVPLDTWRDEPTGDDIVEMTRQTVGMTAHTFTDGSSYTCLELDNYSVYVVCKMRFYSANPATYFVGGWGSNYATANSIAALYNHLNTTAQASKLDWAPRLDIIETSVGGEFLYWDMDNYSLISKEALSRLHDACVLSLFKLELKASKE